MTKNKYPTSFAAARSVWFAAVIMIVTVVSVSAFLITNGAAAADRMATPDDVRFWAEITGSDKDGFDLFAANSEEQARSCKATVTVTMGDGSTKSFTYEKTVRKTDKMSFGGEAGLKPAPIKDVTVSSSGCQSS